ALQAYLSQCRAILARSLTPTASEVTTVVMGNEACDLDSAVCSLALAYCLDADPSMSPAIPLLNVRRKELPLRPDILVALGNWLGLPEAPETLLPCRDDAKDVELFQAVRDGRIRLALVDHNVLRGKDAALASGVFMVIDHHVKEGIWTSKVDTTIELVGSCSSLVAIRLLNNDSVISNRLKTTPGLARALRGAILLDTANMLPAAGKAKPQDEAALNLLESLDSKACGGDQSTRAADYAALLSARRDLSRFAGVDHLRRDVKTVCGGDGGSVVVGLASLATSVAEFLRRSDAAKAIEEFSAEANCSILLLLGIEVLQQSNDAPPDGAVDIRRDLAIVCTRPACQLMTEKLVQYLLCEHKDPDLQLEELTIDCLQSGRLFTQHNLKASRKQILPAVLQFLNSIKEK
ncbi:hypothetical protein BOX15_Mlig015242g2, partial [Macrostomum lignano]